MGAVPRASIAWLMLDCRSTGGVPPVQGYRRAAAVALTTRILRCKTPSHLAVIHFFAVQQGQLARLKNLKGYRGGHDTAFLCTTSALCAIWSCRRCQSGPSRGSYGALQNKRVSSFLAQWEGRSGGVMRTVSNLSQGMTSSLGRLLPRGQASSASLHEPAMTPLRPAAAAQVKPGMTLRLYLETGARSRLSLTSVS